MRVDIYLKYTKNGYVLCKIPMEGSEHHYAIWKPATVSNWWPIQRNFDLVTQERKAWEVLLEETSLKDIFNFRPALVPKYLVNQILETTILTMAESNQIEREAMLLWGGSKAKHRKKYHPILEMISNAMVFAEKLQLQVLPDIDDMDVKTYQQILQALNSYAEVMNISEAQRRLRTQAVQQSGVGKYVKR